MALRGSKRLSPLKHNIKQGVHKPIINKEMFEEVGKKTNADKCKCHTNEQILERLVIYTIPNDFESFNFEVIRTSSMHKPWKGIL